VVPAVGHAGSEVSTASEPAQRTDNRQLMTTPTIPAMKRLLPLALLVLTALSTRADLPFIENDYTKAIAQARAKNLLIFVEAWAPW
jgi:hypothetical protein